MLHACLKPLLLIAFKMKLKLLHLSFIFRSYKFCPQSTSLTTLYDIYSLTQWPLSSLECVRVTLCLQCPLHPLLYCLNPKSCCSHFKYHLLRPFLLTSSSPSKLHLQLNLCSSTLYFLSY